jgi:hypothetical protein
MAIAQAMCSSFKPELLGGIHDIDTDAIFIALYTSSATLGAATTAYTATNEVATAGGYTAGGIQLTSPVITLDGTTGICDFADATWPAATITARGALIYNSSKSDKAIAVLDFGSDKISTAGAFTVIMPAAAAATALVRIA